MKLVKSLLFTLPVFAVFCAPEVHACACCAEYGHYSLGSSKPDSFTIDELKRLRFSAAELYLTAGEDEIPGIDPVGTSYQISGQLLNRSWKLHFTDDKGRAGMLDLPLPASIGDFLVDIHDGNDGGAGSPLLYKELRFKYTVKNGSGIFGKGIKPATEYSLVLQGRGNLCLAAENYTYWRLDVTGKNARFAFFGKLTAEGPAGMNAGMSAGTGF